MNKHSLFSFSGYSCLLVADTDEFKVSQEFTVNLWKDGTKWLISGCIESVGDSLEIMSEEHTPFIDSFLNLRGFLMPFLWSFRSERVEERNDHINITGDGEYQVYLL